MTHTDWDGRFLKLAEHIAHWSKDPSTQVGAVITDSNRRIVSVGYNGFPKGIADDHDRLYDREIKYALMVHAEANALMFAQKSLSGCTLYTWPFMPCRRCAGMVVQSGLMRVAAPRTPEDLVARWGEELKASYVMLREGGILVELV